jgi:hypothetical protein
MNAALEQLKHQFEQALVAAFGSDYAGIDPMLVAASNPNLVIISQMLLYLWQSS